MICRLCLKDESGVMQIFGKQGMELNIADVLTKHFWFEPQADDPISTAICNSCWCSVSVFHEFYLNVEEAHRLLTERFSFKRKRTNERKQLASPSSTSFTNALKYNLIADNNETLDLQIDEILNSASRGTTPTPTGEINNEAQKSKLSHKSVCEDDCSSLGNETLIEEVPSIDLAEESEDILAPTKNYSRRVTRSSTAVHGLTSGHPDNVKETFEPNNGVIEQPKLTFDHSKETGKRRGRPPKIKTNENVELSNTKNKPTEDENVSEKRVQHADEEIAKFMRLICDICSQEEATFLKLRKHMEREHQVKGYVKCCNKKFIKRALLLEHAYKHLNPDCYKCKDCDKTFADKQCMRNHILIKHQPEEAKIFQCDGCPKRFARPYILEQHRMTHEERTHICDICQRGFASSNMLTTHIRARHSNYGAEMCDICAKVIRGRTAFARHQLEHKGVVLPKVQCDICGSWHKDKYCLQKHKRRHNDEGKEFVCNICGKVSPNRNALQSHQRYVHLSERTFECSVCQKAFKKAINLKEHMALHTGEVLYRCPHCPKTFNSNANMHSHRKKCHWVEFEEARKLRRLNISNEPIIKQISDRNSQSEEIIKQDEFTDMTSVPQMITIKSADGQETHKILVTTEEFSDNELDNLSEKGELVFTIN